MKSDDIKRSVRPQSQSRAAGDAPNMGRVSRMPGTGIPKGERRKRKKGEGKSGNRVREGNRVIVLIWSSLLGLVVVASLAVAIWLGLFRKSHHVAPPVAATSNEAVEVVEEEISDFPPPSDVEAVAIVKDGLAVRDAGKVSDYFRLGLSTAEEAIAFLDGLELSDGKLGELDWLGNMDANHLLIEGVLVTFKTESKPRNRVALLTPDRDGKWQIDFDAFARKTQPALTDILGKKVEKGLMRVYVAAETYYNGPFSDDSRWVSFGLASSDSEEVLLGYCEVGSPQAAAMKSLLSKDSPMIRATVEVSRVEGALPRQFLISKVIAEDWVVGPKPFEDRFK